MPARSYEHRPLSIGTSALIVSAVAAFLSACAGGSVVSQPAPPSDFVQEASPHDEPATMAVERRTTDTHDTFVATFTLHQRMSHGSLHFDIPPEWAVQDDILLIEQPAGSDHRYEVDITSTGSAEVTLSARLCWLDDEGGAYQCVSQALLTDASPTVIPPGHEIAHPDGEGTLMIQAPH